MIASIDALSEKEKRLGVEIGDLLLERRQMLEQLNIRGRQLAKLGAQPTATSQEIEALRAQVSTDAQELKSIFADLQTKSKNYSGLIAEINVKFARISEKVSSLFEKYCKSLLREKCVLGVSTYRDQVGQEYFFDHPCFDVYMTSATSPDVPTLRRSRDEVSESQREFIDLAFRMALIDATAAYKTPAMLVIETPEASLDGFFIDQAGRMLKSFGDSEERPGNVVIVTSNLNRQNLIGSILGFTEPEEKWPAKEEVAQRLMNLLALSKENGALRESRPLYERILSDATHGRA